MKKILFLVLTLALLAGCATLPRGRYETGLNIHDAFLAAEEPNSYEECVKLDIDSFNPGESFWFVVRFGGLQPDDNGMLFWYRAGELYWNTEFIGMLGPFTHMLDLNDPTIERDKYLYYETFTYLECMHPGHYEYKFFFLDGVPPDVEAVETSIEFTLSENTMQLWDELMGKEPTTTPI